MIRCYLDNQPVQSPAGLDSIVFRKSRHRTYWGWTYRSLGYADGLNVLGFTEPSVIDYLTNVYQKLGILAQTSFRLESDDEGVLYDGWINYEQKVASPALFSVSLRDDQSTAQIESQATTTINLTPNQTLTLSGRQLDGTANLELDPSRATVKRYLPGSGKFIDHSLPIRPTSDKEQPVVGSLLSAGEPLANPAFYQNTTASPQKLRLRGRFDVALECNFPGMISFRLLGAIEGPLLISQQPLPSVMSAPRTVAVDLTCTVAAGALLSLNAYMPNDASSYTFVYSDISLSLSRVETSPDSIVPGLSVADAFRQLIALITSSRKRALVEGLDRLFITNGLNLRGIPSPITFTLKSLFEGLNAIYNLSMSVEGDVVRIAPKTRLWQRGTVTTLDSILSLQSTPNSDLLFSELLIGYASGTGNSLLSALEPNTSRTYRSQLTTIRSTMNLTSSIITSGTVIEEQRRKQFDTATSGGSKAVDLDQALFLITTDGAGRSAALRGLDSYDGLTDAQTSYNLAITPRRNLERWRWLLTGGGSLSLTQSDLRQDITTHYRGEHADLSENQPLVTATRTVPDVWYLSASLSQPQYADLGDWIVLPDGRRGLLMDAEWQLTESGSQCNMTLWDVPNPSF